MKDHSLSESRSILIDDKALMKYSSWSTWWKRNIYRQLPERILYFYFIQTIFATTIEVFLPWKKKKEINPWIQIKQTPRTEESRWETLLVRKRILIKSVWLLMRSSGEQHHIKLYSEDSKHKWVLEHCLHSAFLFSNIASDYWDWIFWR